MFSKFFRKKKEKITVYNPNSDDSHYYMDTDKYTERTDEIYEYARIYPYDSVNYHSDDFLDVSYDIICKLAENYNLCYYVEYDKNLAEHNEVIDHLQKNFKNGDVYSIIYSEGAPLLCINQYKPTVEIMRKAGKDGYEYASGIDAYIYKNKLALNKTAYRKSLHQLGIDEQYMFNISVDDNVNEMRFKYNKSLITFDEIRNAAEEVLAKYGKYLEVEE